ncbi:uncharacterized protein LOC126849959 [Cataglyphis hispanica]|uniref:uncharacterized protein LOC126849959 n=1 Tax=Cataglyphis hispanica TaxID=1086592 RepID=UPI00217F835D|nr:uncharacterized protein LOC126849959 [Cataglyphis hispanica]
MANPGHITLIRIEEHALQRNTIPDSSSVSSLEEGYGSAEDISTSPDTSCRSSADADKSFDLEEDFRKKLTKFEDIIEKIENLRFTHDEDDDNKENANENVDRSTRRINSENNVDNVEYRDTCKSRANSQLDNEDINNNEDCDNVTIDDNEDCLPLNIREDVEERRRLSLDDRNSLGGDFLEAKQERRQKHKDSNDSNLIQRGPIKPDYQPLRAGHPYSMVSCLSRVNNSVDVDYDKTAEQILRNKDYSEKLNPCLDQLSNSNCRNNQSSIGAIVAGLAMDPWIGENGNDIFHSGDPNDTATLPSIIVNEPGEESLMDILSRDGFQAAILSDAGSYSTSSPRSAKTWSDSPASSYNYVVSRSNSRASSRAQSPGSATNSESPQMHVNVIGSPLGSPQVASSYRVPQALLSSSSSSSNQSYSDVSSPSNYQTPLNYQLEEQLGETLSDWRGTYDSSGTIINSSDTIDCALLQLVEQVIEEDKQRKESLKEPQIALNAPCFSSSYNDRCIPSVRGTLENNLERECLASDAQKSEKPTCLNVLNVNPISNLMSVYTNKQSTSGGTLVNCAVDGSQVSPSLKRYYETSVKNPQVDVTTCHNTLHNITLNDNEKSVKMIEQNAPQEKYGMFRAVSNGEKRYNQASSTLVPNNYQIPPMVFSSFVSNRPQRNSNRGILPWPSLNLPSVRASERLKEGLHPKEVERAMSNLLKKSVKELAAADEDGDTALMCLVGNPEELTRKKAYLAPLVERLGNMPGALSMVNNRGEDALYLAAMNCPEMPYVSGYLAATMLQKGLDINQRLSPLHGDTLIHSVAARGDSHGEVLAELLTLKTLEGNSVFNLSNCNYDGKTALHLAVEAHDPTGRGIKSLVTTRLLLENGADLKVKENKCGDTALHMAASLSCDPALVKVLLCKATSRMVNETNYMCNTPLHMVAAVSNAVTLEKQKEVCRLLIQAGGQTNVQNRQGKTPLALVSPERKEAIKKIFYKKL